MKRRDPWWAWALSIAAICAWLVFHLGRVAACMGECFPDVEPFHDRNLVLRSLSDLRLSTWILASSQHALLSPGTSLFDANAFHPARDVLTGAEHLLGIAVWTLPLRLAGAGAVFVHQAAYVLSYAILGVSTVALTRWLTGSLALATAAGIAAMAMPWRIMELSHIQLLAACWVPLCWLLTLRLLERRGSWLDALALMAVLTLQLLSSYYVAYMLTLTLGLLAATSIAIAGIDRRSFAKLAVAAAIPYSLLVGLSLPYLRRDSHGELFEAIPPVHDGVEAVGWALDFIAPKLGLQPFVTATVPIGVALFALLALGWWRSGDERRGAVSTRARTASIALWLACAFGFLLMLGPAIELGGFVVHLPTHYAMALVPGFENMRAPHRWAIVIGLAAPVLAALGAAWLARVIPEHRRIAVVAVACAIIAGSLPWVRLGTSAAFDGAATDAALYAALEELPDGPVLEMPWPDGLHGVNVDARYMLASTRHGRPMLNGYTGYPPPSVFLLRRIAQQLPDRSAIERLSRLSGLQWIVVHRAHMSPAAIARWRRDATRNGLRPAYLGEQGMVFGVTQGPDAGAWIDRLRGDGPPDQTVTGLTRERLDLPAGAGAIVSVDLGRGFAWVPGHARSRPIAVTIENRSSLAWPGLDVRSEGLVHLRYAFIRDNGSVASEGLAPLDEDFMPGEITRAWSTVEPPAEWGEFALRLELVQRVEGEDLALPADTLETPASVAGGEPGAGARPPEERS